MLPADFPKRDSNPMMEQNPARAARKVAIADHLWDAFESMALQMGTDRDGLVNQAMFMFARLNGFLEASSGLVAESSGAGGSLGSFRPAPPVLTSVPSSSPLSRKGHDEKSGFSSASGKLDDDPVRREVAERVLETAAELERLIKGKHEGQAHDGSDGGIPEADADSVNDASQGESAGSEAGSHLYLMAEGGEMDKIAKDRFVIGRGKHCDFVINSGKVSREHAVISRDGSEFFIEDLGSSNGTWFNKQRIKRRKIEDGDEYFICSEKVKFVYR